MKRYFIATLLLVGSLVLKAQTLPTNLSSETRMHAFALYQEGRFAQALDSFLLIAKYTEKQENEDVRQLNISSRLKACQCYQSMKQYEAGFHMAKSLLKDRLTDSEKKDVIEEYVTIGNFLALFYMSKAENRYADARTLLEEILPYAGDKMKSSIKDNIPLSWYLEGIHYGITLNFNKILECMTNAYHGFHDTGSIEYEIEALIKMAYYHGLLLNFDEAKREYNQAFALALSAGKEAQAMNILKEQRKLYLSLNDVKMVQTFDVSMDSLAHVSNDPKMRIDYYTYRGDEAKSQGQYALAEQWYRKSEPYIDSLTDDNALGSRYVYYSRLRNLYVTSGKYDEALKYAQMLMDEYQSRHKNTDVNYYLPYRGMADVYRYKRDSLNCMRCLDSLFKGLPLQQEPREQNVLYNKRAFCYASFNDYARALIDFQYSDSIMATKYSQKDDDRIALQSFIGSIEYKLGHYEKAEMYYKRYAELKKEVYGENNMDYFDALIFLANAEGLAQHLDSACFHYSVASKKMKAMVRENLPYYTASQRESYWEPISSLMNSMTPFALKAGRFQTPFTQSCYDAQVLGKAFLLESERSTYDVIKNHGTQADLRTYSTIAALRSQIKKLEKNYSRNADSILVYEDRVHRLEMQFARQCRAYGDITSFMDADYNTIKQALGEKDVLIDFADYLSQDQGRKYASYIIDKKQPYPLLIPLFAQSRLDSLQIGRPDLYYDKAYSKNLVELLWAPIKEYAHEGATVYYVPSQVLFGIALESLPLDDGTLLGEHYNFVRLTSAREIGRVKDRLALAADSSRAVLYGGLQYDLGLDAMAQEARKYNLSNLLATRGDIARGDSIFRELPETQIEVDGIDAILQQQRFKVTTYAGKRGTEESFLSMNGKAPQLLHIATHGFYYTPQDAQRVDYLKGYTDAMSLSGLVLSGGNAGWLGKKLPAGVLGGVLTARDISRLDLGATQMVVLSACKTGQGKATSEGLFGLQRAFKKAGAKTIVMSLWNVSDKVTCEFMVKFYEQLASKENNWNKRKAFMEAKSFIRKKYPEPYYWAGFVMLD